MRTTDVTVASGDVRLSGTLAEPDGPAGAVPLVLFLGGSGPLDRDTNMRGQRLNAFPPFAADLAARGIASFRYDKRGAGKSTGFLFRRPDRVSRRRGRGARPLCRGPALRQAFRAGP